MIPHPIDSVAVKLAYESYVTGDYSDATIADLLNAYEHRLDDGRMMHFRMKAVPGRFEARPFSTDAVRGLLQRVIYTGQVVYYGSQIGTGQAPAQRGPRVVSGPTSGADRASEI